MGTETTARAMLAELSGREEVAEQTMAFHFKKPAGFAFKAGQSIDITLQDAAETDEEGNTRTFSIASAPEEEDLMVATRMRDTAFKRVLRNLPPDSKVRIEGPYGNLTLHNNARRAAVLMAGGIGITPFRSMVVHAAMKRLPHQIYLFYSNRRPEDAAFLQELKSLEARNPNYTLIANMSMMEQSSRAWIGEVGQIQGTLLGRYLKVATEPIYYIAGPPGMVSGLRSLLVKTGVDEDDIRSEEFLGY